MPVGVFPQQDPTPPRAHPGPVWARFGQYLSFATPGGLAAPGMDHQQAKA